MTAGPLGRVEPTDFEHIDKYPLTALDETPKNVPILGGFNWYENFDEPVQDSNGVWWIGRGDLGRVRGGHAVCFKPKGITDLLAWWIWHDQISEGICVSEAAVRMMALLNRKRYQPRPTYDWAQDNDEWQGNDYDGTSVRAGLDCLRTQGLVPAKRGEPHIVQRGIVTRPFEPEEGIAANRWATTTDEILAALGTPDLDYVDLLNSWGRKYPRRVRVPATVIDRLRSEHGEFGIVTDL